MIYVRRLSHEQKKTHARFKEARNGSIPQWKAEKWARSLNHSQLLIHLLEEALAATQARLSSLEESFDMMNSGEDVKKLIKRIAHSSGSEISNDVISFQEEIIRLKLAKSKLERSEIIAKEKVHYRYAFHHPMIQYHRESLFQLLLFCCCKIPLSLLCYSWQRQ